jgi:hypothetical protein
MHVLGRGNPMLFCTADGLLVVKVGPAAAAWLWRGRFVLCRLTHRWSLSFSLAQLLLASHIGMYRCPGGVR